MTERGLRRDVYPRVERAQPANLRDLEREGSTAAGNHEFPPETSKDTLVGAHMRPQIRRSPVERWNEYFPKPYKDPFPHVPPS